MRAGRCGNAPVRARTGLTRPRKRCRAGRQGSWPTTSAGRLRPVDCRRCAQRQAKKGASYRLQPGSEAGNGDRHPVARARGYGRPGGPIAGSCFCGLAMAGSCPGRPTCLTKPPPVSMSLHFVIATWLTRSRPLHLRGRSWGPWSAFTATSSTGRVVTAASFHGRWSRSASRGVAHRCPRRRHCWQHLPLVRPHASVVGRCRVRVARPRPRSRPRFGAKTFKTWCVLAPKRLARKRSQLHQRTRRRAVLQSSLSGAGSVSARVTTRESCGTSSALAGLRCLSLVLHPHVCIVLGAGRAARVVGSRRTMASAMRVGEKDKRRRFLQRTVAAATAAGDSSASPAGKAPTRIRTDAYAGRAALPIVLFMVLMRGPAPASGEVCGQGGGRRRDRPSDGLSPGAGTTADGGARPATYRC